MSLPVNRSESELFPTQRLLKLLNIIESPCTTERLESRVELLITHTVVLGPNLVIYRTVVHRTMEITNVVEIMHLGFVHKKSNSYRMNRSITPSFVEEPIRFVQVVEESSVGF
ncbi:hypothetical protein WICPIJ_009818 [Wickerhamomyces pijperi]|uniref:Uncharacterized protein n=1 Tax=Wickerhamomyces pijperi TaxID=599730 RepID=A0A9P8TCG2_WICPI|nr:hypothetical protein WICPIJ_009818 [Wickerhamomyces pijperi]